jgi:hypothetical protein
MGEYEILVTPNKLDIKNKEPIHWNNNVFHHIHVNSNSVCFGGGNNSEKYHEMLARLNLKELVFYVYKF